MSLPQTTTQLVKVFYPNGNVAYAPVFLDGYYYGKADVEAGQAVVETTTECPLDRYYEWACHSPAEGLERIERTFDELLEYLDVARVGRVIELVGTSEVYTHFRRHVGLA